MVSAPAGQVTLAFTDLQGSTALWEKLGDAFRPVLEDHHRLVRAAVAACSGYEVKTEGDSFMVAFARASDALRFAMRTQEVLHAHSWPDSTGELLARIGLHLGEPLCITDSVTGRADYYGPAVNRAARIAAAAHGGQVLMSAAVWEAAAEARDGVAGEDLGEHRLRGLERPERLWQALPAALATRTFPPARTLSGRPTNLPEPATSFVGRDCEIRELSAVLRDPATRLVTLTGPGGTGKTRLALRVAADLLDDAEGGVWFADLSEARTAADLGDLVARALGVTLTASESSVERVAGALQLRKPLILVLDNFEQVAASAPSTIGLWRRRAPLVRLLVTSRSVLGLDGEREYEVPPLGVPEVTGGSRGTARPEAYDGVRLFLERAREADAKFQPDAAMIPAIAELVANLEGIPLAIELAAARMKVLRPAEILARLDQRFQVLRSTRRDLPVRQQTLLGAIDWSYDLLSPWERSSFQQLGAFRGGFSLEDAESVLDLSPFRDAPDVLTAIQTLREKSFLRTIPCVFGTRFGMYVSLQEYGRRKWEESAAPEAREGLDRRHGDRVVGEAERLNERLRGPGVREALDRQEADLPNVFAAQERALARGDIALAARALLAVVRMLGARGRSHDIRERLEAVWNSSCSLPPDLRMGLAAALAPLLRAAGAGERAADVARTAADAAAATGQPNLIARSLLALHGSGALPHLEESISLVRRAAALAGGSGEEWLLREARQALAIHDSTNNVPAGLSAFRSLEAEFSAAGDRWRTADCLYGQARNLDLLDRRSEALAAAELSGEIYREIGDRRNLVQCMSLRGWLLSRLGSFVEACRWLREAVDLLRESGDREGLALALHTLGNVELDGAAYTDAREHLEEGLRLATDIGHHRLRSRYLSSIGNLHRLTGAPERARASLDEARAVAARIGYALGEGLACNFLVDVLAALREPVAALAAASDGIRLLRQCNAILLLEDAELKRTRALLALSRGAEALAQADAVIGREQASSSENAPTHCQALVYRALALQVLGREEDARQARREAEARIARGGKEIPKLQGLQEMRLGIGE